MRKLLLLLAVVGTLMLPAVASADPSASLTGLNEGQCVGGPYTNVPGSATITTKDSPGHWTFSVRRGDTNELLEQSQGSTPVSGFTIHTRPYPTATLAERLDVTEDSTGQTVTATRAIHVNYDRQDPTAPTVKAIRAVAGLQVLTEVSGAADLGCSGGVQSLSVLGRDQNNIPAFGLGTLPSLFANGNLSTGGVIRSQSVLSLCSHYGAQAFSSDVVGNDSPGAIMRFDTPCDASVHVAGKLFDSRGNRLKNVLVTATGGGSAPPPARSNGEGWYDLAVPESSQQWTLTYSSPDCDPGGFMERLGYCSRVVTTTDTVYTGGLSGQIVWPLRSKTLATP
jgi:hypothetical protein